MEKGAILSEHTAATWATQGAALLYGQLAGSQCSVWESQRVDNETSEPDIDDDIWRILSVGSKPSIRPYKAQLEINGKLLTIHRSYSVPNLSENTTTLSSQVYIPLSKTTSKLRTYTAQPIAVA